MVIDDINQHLVASHDVYLADGNGYLVEVDVLHVKLLDFPLDGFFAPYEVVVIACHQSHHGHFRRLLLYASDVGCVFFQEIKNGVIGGLEYYAFFYQFPDGEHAAVFPGRSCHNTVVVNDVFRPVVLLLVGVATCVCQDEVCLSTFKGLDGVSPFLHDETAGYVQLLEDGFEYIDIGACGLTVVVEELIGCFVPVTDNDDGPLAVVGVGWSLGADAVWHEGKQ